MKRILMVWALLLTVGLAQAQSKIDSLDKSGDLYHGLTKKLSYNRMIAPYGIEVTYGKTVHIIFPSAVRYVDLGSNDIIAGKADGADNVIRVKAAVNGFARETNFSVITEDGSFYSFNVKYAAEPEKLNIEMKDFLHENGNGTAADNPMNVYLKDLGSESPVLVRMIMKSIYNDDRRIIRHIGCKRFGVQLTLKSIYVYKDNLYFHLSVKNDSNLGYDLDFIRFKIIDKRVPKRTAIQETVLPPIRAFNSFTAVEERKTARAVYAMEKFTIPDDKLLVVELFEKNGGRTLSITIENSDIVCAETVNELRVK